ncbi:unnamed protein product [Cyprideis torosa]|uniref:Uncharacterized protein n=1 Tax=Cyprideis torosa TaxID=163714 RepID=A0A7R8WJE7_9CRUS|nr:unnamed protein product [Cyprideis torosa]CAG0901893.1 unnamed protein product [Cyprideis torosa]
MKLAILLMLAVASVRSAKLEAPMRNEVQMEAPSLNHFKHKTRELFSRFLKDFVHVFVEEKNRGAFTAANVADLIKGASEETARMLPSNNVPLKLALGVGGVLVGLSSLGYGSREIGRSLSDAYSGFDWRGGISAMARDDFLERTFDWMNIQEVDCKRKIVCEVEQYAANKSTFKAFILRFLSKRHPGLAPYQDAVDNGLDSYDCAEIYDTCPHSFTDIVGSIPVDRLGINLDYINSVPWKLIAEKLQEVKEYLQ